MIFCRKVSGPVPCNGSHAKKPWLQGEWHDLVETAAGKKPQNPTSAKVAWDDDFLYILFRCHDSEIIASYENYNDPIFTEDVVEVFLDDNTDRRDYIEIELSPNGVLLHYAVHNAGNGNVITFARTAEVIAGAVKRFDQENLWYAEIHVPFSELIMCRTGSPRPGDRWLFNLYRIDRRPNAEDEYSALFPTGAISFHKPDRFGELVFGGDTETLET